MELNGTFFLKYLCSGVFGQIKQIKFNPTNATSPV